MSKDPYNPRPALGMTSMVLGLIGMALFFLPVLGIPLSLFGVGFGIIGGVWAWFVPGPSLRFSLAGIALSSLALGANLAIAAAPADYRPSRTRAHDDVRPAVPPPAGGEWLN